jgi:hypothetical protein
VRHNLRMPSFLEPDAVEFSLKDKVPMLRLAMEQPALTPGTPGWSVMVRLTMCIVDGPDDAGFLFPRMGPDGRDPAPEGWDEAFDRAGGCLVAFGMSQATFVPSVS